MGNIEGLGTSCPGPGLQLHPAHEMHNTRMGADPDGDEGDVALPLVEPRPAYDTAMLAKFQHVDMANFQGTMLKAVVVLKRRAQSAKLAIAAKEAAEAEERTEEERREEEANKRAAAKREAKLQADKQRQEAQKLKRGGSREEK